MSDVVELPGICPLCNRPIEAGELAPVNEDGLAVHASCWARSQDPGQTRNNSY
jgi:hypothetical protein